MLKRFSKTVLKVMGWKLLETELPQKKYVLIGAPHTSNWDFPLTLLCFAATGIKASWVAKDSIFKPPLGTIFRSIGGIGIDRSRRRHFLQKIKTLFDERENFILAISPEGTRSYTDHWKLGFYQVALEADAPVALGVINYETKEIGIDSSIKLTGEIEEDFAKIVGFYNLNGKGLYPQNASKVTIREKELRIFKNFKAKNS